MSLSSNKIVSVRICRKENIILQESTNCTAKKSPLEFVLTERNVRLIQITLNQLRTSLSYMNEVYYTKNGGTKEEMKLISKMNIIRLKVIRCIGPF